MTKTVKVAIAGLGFGAEFIPIYQHHPNVDSVAICQRSEKQLHRIGDHFNIPARYTSFEEMLQDETIDAVHINTPIPDHAEHSIAALLAGKHVACTVPMATSLADCLRIVEAQQASGKNYMLMETAVFTREFLYAKHLRDSGELGRIQFLKGAHHQDMSGWPGYWEGLPPMHYSSHAIGPLLALAGKDAEAVSCLGSGRIEPNLAAKYGSPFAVESALFRLADSDLAAEVTRSLFQTSRQYIESFDVYAEKMSFEWRRLEHESPMVFKGNEAFHIIVQDYAHLLPEGIRSYTSGCLDDLEENQSLGLKGRSSHGGSHPHMAHEFIKSIVDARLPFPDAVTAFNWTAAGLCAHESALRMGESVRIPSVTRRRDQ